MGIFDRFNKKAGAKAKEAKKEKPAAAKKALVKKTDANLTSLKPKTEGAAETKEIKGKKAKKEETKEAYRILIKPLVTEKATNLVAKNQYTFMVANGANKIEVKKAIKGLYGFEAKSVNIIKARGKDVRSGKVTGKKKNWRKAIVTLKPSDKIEIYEGV